MFCRRADAAEAEATASSAAEGREAVGGLVEAALPENTADNADKHCGAGDCALATPVTPHRVLCGVKNAIDASYVSSRRHLSRRVCLCQSLYVNVVSTAGGLS